MNQGSPSKVQGKSGQQPKPTPKTATSQPGPVDPADVNFNSSRSDQGPSKERSVGVKKGLNTKEAGAKTDQMSATEQSGGNKKRMGLLGPTGNTAINVGGLPKAMTTQPTWKKTTTTNQTNPVRDDEGASLEEVRKSSLIIKGDTPMRTTNNNGPAKPALKKRSLSESSAASGKKDKRKKKEKQRARSVTFLTEPYAGSAMVPSRIITTKPETKTGFKEMSVKDFSVILGFWFIRFFIPWVDAWHNFNFYLLREPSFWDPIEKDIQTRDIIVFSGTCVTTVLLSLFADFVNFKFYIYSALLLLFIFCPITGALLNDALVARAYDRDFYRKWSVVSDALFNWTLAVAHVSFPIQLSCIFSHKDDMSRQAHYNWTAALVFLESLNRYIAFWVIPGKCPTKTFTQSAIWFLIGATIFTIFLLTTNFFFEWANPDIMHSNRYLHHSMGYVEESGVDVKTKRKKFIWFSSTLSLLVITSLVFATLDRLRPHEDWDKHNILSATSMFYLGEILGVVFMVVVLLVVRWKLPYYHHLPFLRPDVLALGLPHIINLIALATLLGRFATLSQLKPGDVIIGPIPENKKMVAEFYNFEFRNRTVCIYSTSFRPLKIGPRERGTREIYSLGLPRIHFSVTLDPQTTPGLASADSFKYEDDTWATFLITLPFSNIKFSDIQALYSKPEIVRVEGTQSIRPKKQPQVFFMNTYVTSKDNYLWMFYVKQNDNGNDSGFYHEFRYMLKWQTVIIDVPVGHLEIGFHLVNSSFPPQTVRTEIKADKYGVWSVLLGHARPMKKEDRFPPRMIKAFETMETAAPNSGRFPSKEQLQRDWFVMAGMTLAGLASSGIFTGMIYLLWIDTPFISYRTTCIGVLWVLLEVPAELSKFKVVDIDFIVISVLAFLQIICTVLHFITASHLYVPKYNFRK